MLRNYFFYAVCAFAMAAAPARAYEQCSIPMRLKADQEYLPYKVYVKPSEIKFVASYGFTVTPGLINGYGLSAKQIFDWFDVNGCQDELVDWVMTKGLKRLEYNPPAVAVVTEPEVIEPEVSDPEPSDPEVEIPM